MNENQNESTEPTGAKRAESIDSSSLFIGGCWDGRRLIIPDDLSVVRCPNLETKCRRVVMGEDPSPKETKYRRETMGAPRKSWVFYVSEDLTIEDAVDRLINGYNQPNQ